MGIVTVACTPTDETQTHVQVSYKYIALSEKGRTFIESFTEAAYAEFIEEWESLLLNYFNE